MICSSPLFLSSLWFSCLLVHSPLARAHACVCVSVSVSCASSLALWSSFPVSSTPCFNVFVLGLTLLTRVLGDDCKYMTLLPGMRRWSRFLRTSLSTTSLICRHCMLCFFGGVQALRQFSELPVCTAGSFYCAVWIRGGTSAVGLWPRWEPTLRRFSSLALSFLRCLCATITADTFVLPSPA